VKRRVGQREQQDHGLDRALDQMLIQLAEGALSDSRPVTIDIPIRNTNRTVGTLLGSEVTRRYGAAGLPEGVTLSPTLRLSGTPLATGSGTATVTARDSDGDTATLTFNWTATLPAGTGTVLVYRQPDGSHVVRFEDLDVSNGPDLLVILSAAPLVDDRAAYSEVAYLSLGDLKGNQGNQNYVVPAEVNLEDYQTVAIWCRRFNYTFNAAEIHSPSA